MKNLLIFLSIFLINFSYVNAQELSVENDKTKTFDEWGEKLRNLQNNLDKAYQQERECTNYSYLENLQSYFNWGNNLETFINNKPYFLNSIKKVDNSSSIFDFYILETNNTKFTDIVITVGFLNMESRKKFGNIPSYAQEPESLTLLTIEIPFKKLNDDIIQQCFCSQYDRPTKGFCSVEQDKIKILYADTELSLLSAMHNDPGPSHPRYNPELNGDKKPIDKEKILPTDVMVPLFTPTEPVNF